MSTNLTDTVNSYTCPLPNPTGDGNLLVMVLRYPIAGAVAKLSRQHRRKYLQPGDFVHGLDERACFRDLLRGERFGGREQITVSFGSGTHYVQMSPYEFYNVATSSALDQAQCNVGSGTSVSAGRWGVERVGRLGGAVWNRG